MTQSQVQTLNLDLRREMDRLNRDLSTAEKAEDRFASWMCTDGPRPYLLSSFQSLTIDHDSIFGGYARILRTHNNDLRNELAETKARNKAEDVEKDVEIALLKSNKSRLENENKRYYDKIYQLEETASQHKKSAKEDIDSHVSATIKSLTAKHANHMMTIQKQLEKEHTQIKRLEEEIAGHKTHIQMQENKADKLEEVSKVLKDDYNTAIAQIDHGKAKIRAQSDTITQLQHELLITDTKRVVAEAQVQTRDNKVHRLQESLHKADLDIKTCQAEAVGQSKEIQRLNKQLKTSEEEFKAAQLEDKEALSKLQNELHKISNKLETQTSRNDLLEVINEVFRERMNCSITKGHFKLYEETAEERDERTNEQLRELREKTDTIMNKMDTDLSLLVRQAVNKATRKEEKAKEEHDSSD